MFLSLRVSELVVILCMFPSPTSSKVRVNEDEREKVQEKNTEHFFKPAEMSLSSEYLSNQLT